MPDDPNLEPIINLMNECFLNENDFKNFVVGSFVSVLNKINERDNLSEKILDFVVAIHIERKLDKLLEKIRKKFPDIYQEYKGENPDVFEENEASLITTKDRSSQGINDLQQRLRPLSLDKLEKSKLDKLKEIYSLCRPDIASPIINNIDDIVTELNRFVPFKKYRYLIQFVVQIKQIFPEVNQDLDNWLNQYGNLFGYAEFLQLPNSINSSQQSSSSVNSSQESSLLIEINQLELEYFKIQAWFWSDTEQCLIEEAQMIKIFIDESDGNKRYRKLLQKLNEFIDKSNKLMKKVGSKDLRIELFISTKLLEIFNQENFYLDWTEITIFGYKVKMCKQYPVIFRLAERLEVGYQSLTGNWERKWREIQSNHPLILSYCPTVEAQLNHPQTIGLILDKISNYEDFFRLILLKAIPIALWSRCDLTSCSSLGEIQRILNNIGQNYQQLPEEIKNERNVAQIGLEHIGHHICLLWDDPERKPPKENQSKYGLSSL